VGKGSGAAAAGAHGELGHGRAWQHVLGWLCALQGAAALAIGKAIAMGRLLQERTVSRAGLPVLGNFLCAASVRGEWDGV
jgi:hypothetical protein